MKLAKRNINSTEPFIYLETTEGVSYNPGAAITVTEGKAVLATGTTKPEYIAVSKIKGGEGELAAIMVLPDMVFEAELSASASALSVGSKVTIASDGERLTATTTSGIAEILEFKTTSKAVGDKVLFKFN